MAVDAVETLCQKAREAIEARDWPRARQCYQQALVVKSDAPDVHQGMATVCFQMRDLPGAAYHFKEVTRLDPLRAVAYVNLGAVYNLLDQLDDAVTVLRRGIQLDVHRAEGYYNLGLVYRRRGQSDLAVQAYQEAIRVNGRMVDAHYNLANLYLEQRQFGQAAKHYRDALELRPNWNKAVHGLEQAEAGLEAASPTKQETPAPAVEAPAAAPASGAPPAVTLDPNRMVDPNQHGQLLTTLHKATIETETHGRQFLQVLEREIEPAIKELSTCLLYPNKTAMELDHCVQKFETALRNIQNAQQGLQTSIERVKSLGEKLLQS